MAGSEDGKRQELIEKVRQGLKAAGLPHGASAGVDARRRPVGKRNDWHLYALGADANIVSTLLRKLQSRGKKRSAPAAGPAPAKKAKTHSGAESASKNTELAASQGPSQSTGTGPKKKSPDRSKKTASGGAPVGRPRGRPLKVVAATASTRTPAPLALEPAASGAVASTPDEKRGRPPKSASAGIVKRKPGRPPKAATEAASPAMRKPGRPPKAATEAAQPAKRKPGRPPKVATEAASPAKRKPGRPPKGAMEAASPAQRKPGRPPKAAVEAASPAKRKPGRPPKGAMEAASPAQRKPGRPPKANAGAAQPAKRKPGRPPKVTVVQEINAALSRPAHAGVSKSSRPAKAGVARLLATLHKPPTATKPDRSAQSAPTTPAAPAAAPTLPAAVPATVPARAPAPRATPKPAATMARRGRPPKGGVQKVKAPAKTPKAAKTTKTGKTPATVKTAKVVKKVAAVAAQAAAEPNKGALAASKGPAKARPAASKDTSAAGAALAQDNSPPTATRTKVAPATKSKVPVLPGAVEPKATPKPRGRPPKVKTAKSVPKAKAAKVELAKQARTAPRPAKKDFQLRDAIVRYAMEAEEDAQGEAANPQEDLDWHARSIVKVAQLAFDALHALKRGQ